MVTIGRCIICVQSLKNDQSVALKCGHTFHRDCVSRWLDHSRTCPTCRKDARDEDIIRLFFDAFEIEDLVEHENASEKFNMLSSALNESKSQNTQAKEEIQQLKQRIVEMERKFLKEQNKCHVLTNKNRQLENLLEEQEQLLNETLRSLPEEPSSSTSTSARNRALSISAHEDVEEESHEDEQQYEFLSSDESIQESFESLDEDNDLTHTIFGSRAPEIIPFARNYASTFRQNNITKASQLVGMVLLYNRDYFYEQLMQLRITSTDTEQIYKNLVNKCKASELWHISEIYGISSVYSSGLKEKFSDSRRYRKIDEFVIYCFRKIQHKQFSKFQLSMTVGKFLVMKKNEEEMFNFLGECCNRNNWGRRIVYSLVSITDDL